MFTVNITMVPDAPHEALHQRQLFYRSMAYNTPGQRPGYDRSFNHANHGFCFYGSDGNNDVEIEVSLRTLFEWERYTQQRKASFLTMYPVIRKYLLEKRTIDIVSIVKTYRSEQVSGHRDTYNCYEPAPSIYQEMRALFP